MAVVENGSDDGRPLESRTGERGSEGSEKSRGEMTVKSQTGVTGGAEEIVGKGIVFVARTGEGDPGVLDLAGTGVVGRSGRVVGVVPVTGEPLAHTEGASVLPCATPSYENLPSGPTMTRCAGHGAPSLSVPSGINSTMYGISAEL